MFGYVTVCKDTLSDEGYNIFKAYYCGLCKAIGKQCSHMSRMGLSYDITFLAIILSSVNSDKTDFCDKRCEFNTIKKNKCVVSDEAVNYAADMGVILSYLKLLDDWQDDRSIKAFFGLVLFRRGCKKAKRRYLEQYAQIENCLKKLSVLEKSGCTEIDETADCFAKILEILFTPDFIRDDGTRRELAWLGYNIGRWIYIIDAYNDLERDIRKKTYNTFSAKYSECTSQEIRQKISETLRISLTFTLENASSAYNLLNLYSNKEVTDNIIYTALKVKQDYIFERSSE